MGGSSSSSAKTTSEDKRLVVAEGGLGISGDGNSAAMTVNTTDGGTLAVADSAIKSALTVSGDSLTNAASLSAQIASQSIAAQAQAIQGALTLSSQNTSQTLSAITSVNRDSLAFADNLSINSLELMDKTQGRLAASFSESLGFGSHIVDQALKSADLSQQGSANAVNQVARAYDTATNYQAEKATTDSRYLVIAGIVAVAIVASKAL